LQIINCEQRTSKRWELTEEGRQIAASGSYEAMIFNNVPDEEGILKEELIV